MERPGDRDWKAVLNQALVETATLEVTVLTLLAALVLEATLRDRLIQESAPSDLPGSEAELPLELNPRR